MKNEKIKKKARKKLEELNVATSKLPNLPKTFTYVKLYQVAHELFGLKEYEQSYDLSCYLLKYIEK